MLWAQSTHEIKDWLQILYYIYARSSKMHRACFFTLAKNDESQSRKKSRVLGISRGMVNDICSSVIFIKSSSSPQSTSQLAVARLRTSQRRPSIGFSAPNHRNFSVCVDLRTSEHRKDLPGAIHGVLYGWELSHQLRKKTTKSHPNTPIFQCKTGRFHEKIPMCVLLSG